MTLTFEQKPPKSANGYMPQLDGLRAIAVGAVILHHFLPLGRFIPYDFVTFGDLGVRLFFVLSGFLITGILLKCRVSADLHGESPSFELRQFYVRRFLRIFPVYYLTLTIIAILNLPTVRATVFWHLGYLSNVYFSTQGSFVGPLSHFWSLAVEEQFYLIWPWLVIFAPKKYLRSLIVITIVAAPLFRLAMHLFGGGELASFILLFGCMDSLGLGALLAYYEWEQRPDQDKRRFLNVSLWAGMLLLTVLVILYSLNKGRGLSAVLLYLATSCVFVWLVERAAFGFKGVMGKALELRPIVYVGRISYGIYIFHNLMPIVVPSVFRRIGLTYPVGPGSTIKQFVILVTATLLLASTSWQFFEGPLNKLKRHFRYNKVKFEKENDLIDPMGVVLDSP